MLLGGIEGVGEEKLRLDLGVTGAANIRIVPQSARDQVPHLGEVSLDQGAGRTYLAPIDPPIGIKLGELVLSETSNTCPQSASAQIRPAR